MSEKRHALLIGNQHYPKESGFDPLNSPHNDVKALASVLKDPKFGRFDEVTVLFDKPYKDTLIAIQNALRKKSKNDVLMIYYSGHGKTDDNNNLYLATPDTLSENLEVTSVDARKVSQLMGDSHAENTVLVLDCCHAGAFPAGFKSDDALQSAADLYANSGGSYVLMACGAYELARDGAEGDLSLLTKHLVEGIAGAADANGDGVVTVSELTEYLDTIMSRGDGQKFNQAGQNMHGDIVLGWSGHTPVEHVLDQARKVLNEWSMTKDILDVDLVEVLNYFAHLRDKGVNKSDSRWDLVQRMSKETINSSEFLSGWLRAIPAPVPTPPPPEPAAVPVAENKPNPTSPFAKPTRAPVKKSKPKSKLFLLGFHIPVWFGFLRTLGFYAVASAGLNHMLLYILIQMGYISSFNFEFFRLAIFAGTILIFSLFWTKALAKTKALNGFKLFLTWMNRILLLASLSYGLLVLFSLYYSLRLMW